MDEFVQLVEKNYENPKFILDAYKFASKAHSGVKRLSGEAYIIHPIEVAKILINLGMDEETVAAALLHDVVEDTKVTFKAIKEHFGENVERLVKGVTKINRLNYSKYENVEMESLKRLFIAMSKDIRVLLIKLADRLHNIRTVQYLPYNRRIKCCTETMNLFVPLAERLGLNTIKLELEDICFQNLNPNEYKQLKEELDRKYEKSKSRMGSVETNLKQALVDLGLKGEVNSRFKHFYSVYKKLKDRGTAKIYDIIAFRIIVDEVKDCYLVLGKIHQMYKPVPGRIKDYIAAPKANGYQSLHTTLIMQDGTPFEVQIRTYNMHRLCEYGIAAHWRYKTGNFEKDVFNEKLDWFRSIIQDKKQFKNSTDFIKALTMDFSSSEIWVFTPKYKPISLPELATPIDMAYEVHTELGDRCVGAKVNGKKVPLNYHLETGDVVEIITSEKSQGPSRDWLKFVVSRDARAHIRSFLRKTRSSDSIKRGREMLEKAAEQSKMSLETLLSKEMFEEIQKIHFVYSSEDLYSLISSGSVKPEEIVNIAKVKAKKDKKFEKVQFSPMLIDGIEVGNVKLAHCCTPIPGDEIVAMSSNNGVITVHCKSCANIKEIDKDKFLSAVWKKDLNDCTFDVSFKITGRDEQKLLQKIMDVLYEENVKINSVMATASSDGKFEINASVCVHDNAEFEEIRQKLLTISAVQIVVRSNLG